MKVIWKVAEINSQSLRNNMILLNSFNRDVKFDFDSNYPYLQMQELKKINIMCRSRLIYAFRAEQAVRHLMKVPRT